MNCCVPRIYDCPIKINDTSPKQVVKPLIAPPTMMCTTYTVDWEGKLIETTIPCNDVKDRIDIKLE